MEAGPELDAKIAELMGIEVRWRICHDLQGKEWKQPYKAYVDEINAERQARGAPLLSGGEIDSYSTDIAAAFGIAVEVGLFRQYILIQDYEEGYWGIVELASGEIYDVLVEAAETAPLAICLAVLKLKGIDAGA